MIAGKPFSRGALYLMLRNRTYRGKIVHKGQSHPCEHPPIIDQPLWDAVQAPLTGNSGSSNAGTGTRQPSLLAKMLFDRDGNRRFRHRSPATAAVATLAPALASPACSPGCF